MKLGKGGRLGALILGAALLSTACTASELQLAGRIVEQVAVSVVAEAIKQGRTGAQANPNRPSSEDMRQEGGPSFSQGGTVSNLPSGNTPGKTLLALYVIGSDLEDGGADHQDGGALNTEGAATADFKEIAEGLGQLSDAERQNIEVLLYFGGSKQEGWRGLKVLDSEGILKDAEDGYFGNDSGIYLKDQEGTDMGAARTWQAFLSDVKAKQGGYAKVLVDVWNHGGSWNGMGPDSLTGSTLPVDTLKAGLQATGLTADLIGYDACLMGSVEVAGAMTGHFRYLLASEELEPGHGWAYAEPVAFIGKNPNASVSAIAKVIVDQFVEHPSHSSTDGKTLSLVDLQAFQQQLAPALSRLGSELQDPSHISPYSLANQRAQRYGVHGGDSEVSRDLGGLAQALNRELPSVASTAQALEAGLKACVVYAREDGTKPDSSGLSLYSIDNASDFNQGYTLERAFPQELFNAFASWQDASSGDTTAPQLAEVDENIIEPAGRRLLQAEPLGASALRVTDDVGLADVEEMHARLTEEGFELVGTAPATQLPNQEGLFMQPRWNGRTIHIFSRGKSVALSTAEELGDDGFSYFTAPIVWNGERATLYLVADASGQVVGSSLQVFLADGKPAREQRKLAPGDYVEPLRVVYREADDSLKLEAGAPFELEGRPVYRLQRVEGQAFAFTLAEDLKGNVGISKPVPAVEE